jgi:hypothetical protein
MKFFRKCSYLVICSLALCMFFVSGCGKQADTASKQTVPKEDERPVPSSAPITEEKEYFDFETDLAGWEIPAWAASKNDYVAREITISGDKASSGASSMKIKVDFPVEIWSAGLVEIQQYLDLSHYRVLSVDLFLPEDAPVGLKSRFVLTVGDNWKFVEMNRSVPLIPGEWITLSASVEPGSYDWKRVVPDDQFSKDIRKIAVRVESNRQPVYSGDVYIDNLRVGK